MKIETKRVIYVKKHMYNYAPAILSLMGFLLWLISFLTDRYYKCGNVLPWIPYVMLQTVVAAVSGTIIKNLYWQVQTDMLTGLHSRRFFYMKLSELKKTLPVSLLFIDIDDFKSINDTYGHTAGDEILSQFACILKNNMRKNDIIARWGGEEFAVILPRTDASEALKIANRIRKLVEQKEFCLGEVACKLTISVGIAWAEKGKDVNSDRLFKKADEALYKAKEKKNFIVVHEGNED
ncbi:MAG: diguanylate cyclase [Tepidanaerobacteraceae bacterium]|nr:diguanylate cyclase [Tepidanaerobacteraceae bacterium]